MDENKISEYQLATFTACSITTSGIMFFREMVQIAQQDAWFGFFLPMVYAIFLVLITIYLTKHGEKPLLEQNKKRLGLFASNCINFVIFLYLLVLVIMEVTTLANVVKYYLLPKTPLSILSISLIFTVAYLAHTGLEVVIRLGNFVFLPFGLAIFACPLLLFNEIEMSNIFPIATSSLDQIARGSFFQFGLFGEIFLFTFLPVNSKGDPSINKHAIVRGIILGAFLLTCIMIFVIISIGVPITSRAHLVAGLFLTQLVHIAEFMDRLDIFLFSTWFLCYVIRISLFYYLLCSCIGFIGMRESSYKNYTILFIPLIFAAGQLFFRSQIQIFNFSYYVWPILTVGMQIPLLAVMVIKKWMRRTAM